MVAPTNTRTLASLRETGAERNEAEGGEYNYGAAIQHNNLLSNNATTTIFCGEYCQCAAFWWKTRGKR